PEPAPDRLPLVYVAAALDHQLDLETGPDTNRFAVPDGWRMGAPAWTPWRLRAPGHEATVVRVRRNGEPGHYLVRWAEKEPQAFRAHRSTDGTRLTVTDDNTTITYARADDPDTAHRWLGLDGATWSLREEPVSAALRADRTATDGTVRSPMPGTVLDVPVEVGQHVTAGTTLAVVEAMKMEHSVPAPVDGTVTTVTARPGTSVSMDAPLVTVEPRPGPADTRPEAASTPPTSEESQ
ncbi:MAG TPA: acetyl/propionyl-CoA carboxylase subunit alpha, partial [Candidatus Nocardiopsis merdipullorum]|nr:acetyl/propionyl-CoA carboxylase subunit alpha [Candidatus Nocardiopsis merdipullorum]